MRRVGGVDLSRFIAVSQKLVEKHGETNGSDGFQIAAKIVSLLLLVRCRHREHYFAEVGRQQAHLTV